MLVSKMSRRQTLTSLTKVGPGAAPEDPEKGAGDSPRIVTLINDEVHLYGRDSATEGAVESLGKFVEGVDLRSVALFILDHGASEDLLGRKSSKALSQQIRRRRRSAAADEYGSRLRRLLQERTEPSTEDLADQLMPDAPIPSPLKVLGARREAEARLDLLREFGAYSAEELGELRSKAENRHALASRWRSKGKVFSVDYRGRQLFPGFQFDPSAAPLPVVADVLAALPREEMSEWEVALWWVAANEWLGGERPVDLLGDDPAALPSAASRLTEPSAL